MKLLPKNLESRISWEAIQDEFGSTEVIFIAFGNEGKSIFNPVAMATLWDLTEALETGKQIEELNSITTATRMDNLDGFMEVDDLQPDRNLSQEEINDLKDYLDKNTVIKKRFVSQDDQYFLISSTIQQW